MVGCRKLGVETADRALNAQLAGALVIEASGAMSDRTVLKSEGPSHRLFELPVAHRIGFGFLGDYPKRVRFGPEALCPEDIDACLEHRSAAA